MVKGGMVWVGEDFGGGFCLLGVHIILYILISCLCFNLSLFVRRGL